MYGGPSAARSPPPLQHPRPQHPPSHIPSQSPPPDAYSYGGSSSTEYQRFSSPPVQPAHAQQHQQHQGQRLHPTSYGAKAAQQQQHAYGRGPATPDAYIPANAPYGAAQQQYGVPGAQQQQPGVAWMGGGADSAPSGPVGGGVGGGAAPAVARGPAQQQQQGAPPSGWPGMGGAGAAGGMNGMMNDATAQMGVQFGKHALTAGQAYLDKNFTRLLPLAHLKHSFNVSNGYVVNKLRLIVWPWRHRPWSRSVVRNEGTGVAEGWKPPREDLNCPDLYIPGASCSLSPSRARRTPKEPAKLTLSRSLSRVQSWPSSPTSSSRPSSRARRARSTPTSSASRRAARSASSRSSSSASSSAATSSASARRGPSSTSSRTRATSLSGASNSRSRGCALAQQELTRTVRSQGHRRAFGGSARRNRLDLLARLPLRLPRQLLLPGASLSFIPCAQGEPVELTHVLLLPLSPLSSARSDTSSSPTRPCRLSTTATTATCRRRPRTLNALAASSSSLSSPPLRD